MSGRRNKLLLTLLYLVLGFLGALQSEDSPNGNSNLPGHLQPLGSHKPPIIIKRIRHLPSPAEFHRDYVVPKVPVVMEGALHGASTWKKWQNDNYLRENFGNELVGIEEGKKENRSDPRYSLSVSEFLDRYEKEDIYMVHDLPQPMYEEWELPRPLLCGGMLENILFTYIWFSSGGTNSVLHTDSFENFHCLVSGKKRFTMFEPHYNSTIGPEHEKKGFYDVDVEKVDMTVYPELSRIPWYLAEVNEGDCLYLPYLWIHNVKSFGRNMGINLWWSPFEFKKQECPPDSELPDYIPLGTVELSPELMIVEALERAADPDGTVHADKLHKMINEMDSIVALSDIKEMFERLQPGCNGVITDYTSIPRANLKKAHKYMNEAFAPPDDELPPDWNPEFEGVEGQSEPWWTESEGGGDGDIDSHEDIDSHDEL